MKAIIALTLLMSSLSVFAWPGDHVFNGVPDEQCPERTIVSDSVIVCKSANTKIVLAAKKAGDVSAAEYAKLGFYTYDAVDLGVIVDADTSGAYFYTKWLVDAGGKKVGVLTINGYHNSEMEVSGRVDVRYNLKGQIVSMESKEI